MAVHAVSGTVKAVTARSIQIQTDADTTSSFKLTPGSKVSVEFEGDLKADTVEAAKFNHVGAFVVVYFYGYGEDQTAVAVKELSAGSYAKVDGKVTAFDKRTHQLTVVDGAGKAHTFLLSDHLIVDTDLGADDGKKYGPHKGEDVRVTYASAGSTPTVPFLRLQN
jgi:hypothetical protein